MGARRLGGLAVLNGVMRSLRSMVRLTGRVWEEGGGPGRLARRGRLMAAPVLVLAGVGAGIGVPRLVSGTSSPTLPQVSAQVLVQRVLSDRPTDLSGKISSTSNLGLSELGALSQGGSGAGGGSLPSFLTGPASARVWLGHPGQLRVSLPKGSQETDVVVDGEHVWIWDSTTQTATRVVVPHGSSYEGAGSSPTLTPGELSKRLLSALPAGTDVSVAGTTTVAHHAAYQLLVRPSDSSSEIGSVEMAVDARSGMVLSVEIMARGQSSPAFEIGFTSLHSGSQPSSYFDFQPPPGAKVVTRNLQPGTMPATRPPVTVMGQGWSSALASPLGSAYGSLAPLLRSAPTISGSGWSGKLLSSSLLNAIVLTSGSHAGYVIVGAVDSAALSSYATHLTQG